MTITPLLSNLSEAHPPLATMSVPGITCVPFAAASEIARRCQVSQSFVTRLRRSLSDLGNQIGPRKVQRGDTVYEMRAKKRSGPKTAPQQSAQTPDAAAPTAWASDRVGIPLPSDTAPAFASLSVFAAAEKLHGQLAVLVDQLAEGAGGAAYRQHLVRRMKDGKLTFYSPELQVFAQRLIAATPHCGYCPRCHAKHPGRAHPACKLCGGRGWLSKAEFETCPQGERQELERLLKQNALGQAG
jgi:hypothetical protein